MRGWMLSAVALALLIASGCGSEPETLEENDDLEEPLPPLEEVDPDDEGPAPLSMTAAELERELGITEAGKVVLQGLRAHGGWDTWREVSKLELAIERNCEKLPGASGGDPRVPRRLRVILSRRGEAGRWRVDVKPTDPRGSEEGEPRPDFPAGVSEDAAVFLVNAAPFSFVRRGLIGEYVGIEVDAASGSSFHKVRFTPPEPAPPFPCTAYFDTTTRQLRRLVLTTPAGKFLLLVYSSWRRPSGSEILVAAERGLHFLETRLEHPDLDDPDCTERVEEARIEKGEE